MNRTIDILSRFVAASILFSIFVAFGNAIAAEPVTLKVFSLPDPKRSDAFAQAQLAVLDAFKKKYPYIKLTSFTGVNIEGVGMDSKPLMAIAGGVAPDVLYVNFRQSDTYIQNNFLYPLNEFIEELEEGAMDLRVPKPVWPVIDRIGPQGKKNVYAIPTSFLVRVLVYRKDLFRKAGLNPNAPPETWDELLDYAKRLTIPEDGTFGIYLGEGTYASWDWLTYLWSAGGEAVVQNPDGTWVASFDSENAVTAMDFYLKLITPRWRDAKGNIHEGFAFRDGNQIQQMWADGKVGMQMTYLNEENLGRGIDPNLYGVAPVPKGPTGLRGAEINCGMKGIFSGAGISNNSGMGKRDPKAVRDAAWKYIWFSDSEEARRIRVEKMVSAGFGGMLNPLYLKRYGFPEYAKYIDPGIVESFVEAAASGKPEPYGKNCQMVYEFMTYPLDQCVSLASRDELGKTKQERHDIIKAVLSKAVVRTNEQMIGRISPKERESRNRMALFAAIIVVAILSSVLYRVWKIFTPKNNPNVRGWMIRKYLYAYIMLIPALGSILIWKYLPMFMGSLMAFQDYQIVGESSWVGLQNFADVLYDPVWWSSLWKTLCYMILSLAFGFWPPILLAILLQEVSHCKVIYRTIYYLPAVITGVIVIYLWKLLYDPSDMGGLNQILLSLGLPKLKWLHDESLAMICCIIPSIWAGLGPGCLIYLAALKGIPDDNYEAADIDGASFFQKIRHIVLPHMKALIIIQFIGAFIAASQQSGYILVMTFGGPNEATRVAGLLIFQKAYVFLKFGIATTMAWILGVVLIGLTTVQLKRLSNMEFKAAPQKN